MQFRVDTDGMTFVLGGVRAVVDFESKQPQVDKVSGAPLFDVDVMAIVTGERPEQLTVRVAGAPAGVDVASRVVISDLTARTWEMGDRHGVSFRASRVAPFVAGSQRSSDKAA